MDVEFFIKKRINPESSCCGLKGAEGTGPWALPRPPPLSAAPLLTMSLLLWDPFRS